MGNRNFNKKSLENLKINSAPDTPGKTIPITNRVTPEQKEWLDAQPEGRSYHVRQALRMYIKQLMEAANI